MNDTLVFNLQNETKERITCEAYKVFIFKNIARQDFKKKKIYTLCKKHMIVSHAGVASTNNTIGILKVWVHVLIFGLYIIKTHKTGNKFKLFKSVFHILFSFLLNE